LTSSEFGKDFRKNQLSFQFISFKFISNINKQKVFRSWLIPISQPRKSVYLVPKTKTGQSNKKNTSQKKSSILWSRFRLLKIQFVQNGKSILRWNTAHIDRSWLGTAQSLLLAATVTMVTHIVTLDQVVTTHFDKTTVIWYVAIVLQLLSRILTDLILSWFIGS
jgi:hypothetical protein